MDPNTQNPVSQVSPVTPQMGGDTQPGTPGGGPVGDPVGTPVVGIPTPVAPEPMTPTVPATDQSVPEGTTVPPTETPDASQDNPGGVNVPPAPTSTV